MSVLSPAQHELRVTEDEETAHEPPSDLICSARGCRGHADWALRWNNPRLHTPARRKTWLACTQHRAYLEDFLAQRGFLRETVQCGALSGD